MRIKLIWHSKDWTYLGPHQCEKIILELGQLLHRVETIVLTHSQHHVLPPMTVSARGLETILVLASQDVVNGPTKFRVLAHCANSLGPIKYRINIRFLSKHDVNVKRYWGILYQ